MGRALALQDIEAYYEKARSGMKQNIAKITAFAETARHNHDALVRCAELLYKFSYHTEVILDVARVAAASRHRYTEFVEIADLSVMKLSGSYQVVDLAKAFAATPPSRGVEKVRRELDQLIETAEYQSIEEAYARAGIWD